MSITTLFNTKHPLIQAPMAGVQGSALAIAVTRAGGLGSLPCAMLSSAQIRDELSVIRAAFVDLSMDDFTPVNVNFFAHPLPTFDAVRESAWRTRLAGFYDEFGIDADSIVTGAGRAAFNDELAGVIEPFKPLVVSFHFGLPSADLMARVKSWGSKIIATATTVAEAVWLEKNGVDAIIAQGLEAGGHRGIFLANDGEPLSVDGWREVLSNQIGIFALLPQILKTVNVPVIAAGGIADAAGVAALLSMGAAAVQVGTAFMLCNECTTSSIHRAALQSPAAQHTALTNLFTGRPARGIINRLMHELGEIGDAPAFPLATSAMMPLRQRMEAAGSGDFTPLWAGQNVSGCRAVCAAVLVDELMSSS